MKLSDANPVFGNAHCMHVQEKGPS